MDKVYNDINGGQMEEPVNGTQSEQISSGAGDSSGTEQNEDITPTDDDKDKSAEERTAEAPKEDFYQTYLEELKKDQEQETERLEKEEKRLKRQKLFASIGDGLAAMHEAYSYGRGVTPITNPSTSLSGKWRERYDKLVDERKKNRQAYTKAVLDVKTGKRKDDIAMRTAQNQADAEARRRAAADLSVRKQGWLEKYQQGKLDVDQERLELDRLYKQGLITKMEKDTATNELRAQAVYLRAQNGGSGVRGYTTKTVVERDARGRETGRTTTRTPANNNNDITPPSKRPK